jgi:hypothetical protein
LHQKRTSGGAGQLKRYLYVPPRRNENLRVYCQKTCVVGFLIFDKAQNYKHMYALNAIFALFGIKTCKNKHQKTHNGHFLAINSRVWAVGRVWKGDN